MTERVFVAVVSLYVCGGGGGPVAMRNARKYLQIPRCDMLDGCEVMPGSLKPPEQIRLMNGASFTAQALAPDRVFDYRERVFSASSHLPQISGRELGVKRPGAQTPSYPKKHDPVASKTRSSSPPSRRATPPALPQLATLSGSLRESSLSPCGIDLEWPRNSSRKTYSLL